MKAVRQNIKSNQKWFIILFLISPVLALIRAIKEIDKKEAQIIILMFAFLFGYTFIIIENSDVTRYRDYYEVVSNFDLGNLLSELSKTYTVKAQFNDVYLLVLMYLSSLLNLSFHSVIGLHAVIYFWILLSIYNLVIKHTFSRTNLPKLLYVFLIGALFIYSLSGGLTGIRFQTAFYVLLLFSLKYIFTYNKKYLIYAGLGCLVHIAVIQAFFVLIAFYFFNKINSFKLKMLLSITLIVVAANLGLTDVAGLTEYEVAEEKIEGYTNKNFQKSREEHTETWNWYIQFKQVAQYYFLMVVIFVTRLFKLKTNRRINDLFFLSLFFLGLSLFAGNILDSISNRYKYFFEFTALIYLLLIFANNTHKKVSKKVSYMYLPILLITFFINLRVDSYTFDIIRLSLSPLLLFFVDEGSNIYNIF